LPATWDWHCGCKVYFSSNTRVDQTRLCTPGSGEGAGRKIPQRQFSLDTRGPLNSTWLTVIGHAKDSLWSVDFFRCESILLKSYWIMVVMDVFSRRIIGFGVAVANLDGPIICRMFNRAIAKQTPPQYLSSDHDPVFRFHRWLANLRVLEVDEIKAIPCTPRSHAFVERLIGTLRREYLDQTLFWNQSALERKLENYKPITTTTGVTARWPELRRLNAVAYPYRQSQNLSHIPGGNIATAYFRPQLLPELEFDTDRIHKTSSEDREDNTDFRAWIVLAKSLC
jgi:transposase InsO family protein